MAINVVTKFLSNWTVKIWAYIYDDDGALVDPTSVKVSVVDPDGETQVDEVAMTPSATGIYYYYYHKGAGEDAMDAGHWRGEILVADGTGEDTVYSGQSFGFEVE